MRERERERERKRGLPRSEAQKTRSLELKNKSSQEEKEIPTLLPPSHSASTRAALTSVTGAPDFSRRALISWSWFEGAAEEEEEAYDRRSSSSRDDDADNEELETERRQSKPELLPSLQAAEKERELDACLSVSARAAARETRARERLMLSSAFKKLGAREARE